MSQYMILLSIGKDRPGIVDAISTILFENGANIEDSRMATLGGRFTSMTLFSYQEQRLEGIKAGLAELRREGIETSLHAAEDPATCEVEAALPLKFDVMAMDHPGIVQRVVRVLHRRNINIQSLNTQIIRAPLSGAPLFDLSITAAVPSGTSIATVKEELTQLAAERDLDLTFAR